MPEILTESFCERCGTRYTFESAAPRVARLKGIKVVSRGLKNFVMSDDTSMDEAMAAARSETDREATAQQLDAFHKTFNFCMNCRQYTCGNCWNDADGQCLSCSPHLGHEIMPAPFPDLDTTVGLTPDAANGTNGSNGSNGHAHDDSLTAMAWPTSDLMRDAEVADAASAADAALDAPPADDLEPFEQIDAAARLAALGAIDAPAVTPVDAVAEPTPEPVAPEEPAIAASAALDPDPEPAAPAAPAAAGPSSVGAVDAADVDGRAAVAADQTSAMFRKFRPGQSLDDEIAAYEAEQAATTDGADEAGRAAAAIAAAAALDAVADGPAEAVPAEAIETPTLVEPVAPQPVAPEPVAASPVVAEPVGAEPAATPVDAVAPAPVVPAPVAPEPPAAAPLPEPVAAEAAPPVAPPVDIVQQPTWQIVAPDATPADSSAPPPAEPQWPAQPEWPSQRPAAGLPFLGRPPAATGGLDALWAESAREVASVPPPAAAAARPTTGVAPCVSCGLSLSATARFCRRCGTRQG